MKWDIALHLFHWQRREQPRFMLFVVSLEGGPPIGYNAMRCYEPSGLTLGPNSRLGNIVEYRAAMLNGVTLTKDNWGSPCR